MIVAFSEIPKVDLLWHMGCCYLLASDKVRSEPLQKKGNVRRARCRGPADWSQAV